MTNRSGDNQNRTVLIIGTLVAAVLVGLALFAVGGKQKSDNATDGKADFDLSNVPFTGKEDAPVTMVVVEDFKCVACKTFQDTVEAKVKTQYADTGKVKIHTIIWPFLAEQARLEIDDSKVAAQAVQCAYKEGGSKQFDELKTYIFRKQDSPSGVWATKDLMKELAAEVSDLDQEKFATCLDNDETAAVVDAQEEQVKKAGINSTPVVYINGEKVQGGFDAVSKAIDTALE